jgi:hypothetical protein
LFQDEHRLTPNSAYYIPLAKKAHAASVVATPATNSSTVPVLPSRNQLLDVIEDDDDDLPLAVYAEKSLQLSATRLADDGDVFVIGEEDDDGYYSCAVDISMRPISPLAGRLDDNECDGLCSGMDIMPLVPSIMISNSTSFHSLDSVEATIDWDSYFTPEDGPIHVRLLCTSHQSQFTR